MSDLNKLMKINEAAFLTCHLHATQGGKQGALITRNEIGPVLRF